MHDELRTTKIQRYRRTDMRRHVHVLAFCGALALAMGPAAAQQSSFDSKKFFDKLQAEGVSMSTDFDAKRFFDKLQAEGVSDSRPLDAKTFFDKLQAEGVSVPSGFDRKKFFDTIEAQGVAAPSMVAPNK
ncbi:MAG: hypothetical protein ACM31O_03310 [Bacteroidota bacterium]